MPLPQQVIDRLSKEPPKTPGWSFGLLLFSGGLFFISLIVYFGLAMGYEPYVDSQTAQVNAQIAALAKSVSPDDQARLTTFYSEVVNVRAVLANHVALSNFFSWLERNTEANVYYTRLLFTDKGVATLIGVAKSETDVNQQVAIFEAAPEAKNVSISNVTLSDTNNLWTFAVALTMDPAILHATPSASSPTP